MHVPSPCAIRRSNADRPTICACSASYLWATAGYAIRTFEAGSVEEILAGPAWFAEAGFDIYILKNIKLRGSMSHRSESGGPKSTALAIITGYRF